MQNSIYMLTSAWEEPCEGTACWSCRLNEQEAKQVEEAITWLREHAQDEWGSTLASWELTTEPGLTGRADLTGLDAVIDELKLNSRYDEDPTFYGHERYAPFEARNAALSAGAIPSIPSIIDACDACGGWGHGCETCGGTGEKRVPYPGH